MSLVCREGPPQRDQAALQGVPGHQEESGGEDSEQTQTESVGREGEEEFEREGQGKGSLSRVRKGRNHTSMTSAKVRIY